MEPVLEVRGTAEPDTAYKCRRCGDVHETNYEAAACCRPGIPEVYLCPHCESVHYDLSDAADCCSERYSEEVSCFICDNCGTDYQSEADAIECCSFYSCPHCEDFDNDADSYAVVQAHIAEYHTDTSGMKVPVVTVEPELPGQVPDDVAAEALAALSLRP